MGTKRRRRTFSEEFKRDAVKRAQTADQPFAQSARELGVSVSLLEIWRRKYGSEPAKANASPTSLEDEVRRLRRENASLREDRDVLKKVAGGSTRHRNSTFSILAGVRYYNVLRGR